MKVEDIIFANYSRVFENTSIIFKGDIIIVTFNRKYRIRFNSTPITLTEHPCNPHHVPYQTHWKKLDISTYDELLELIAIKQLLE